MKKSILFILFILTSIAAFSQTRVSSSWNVYNTSIVPGCPYEVCFYMELRYSATNTTVPGSNVVVCHTIATGSSAYYTYPASPAPGTVIKLTGIVVNIGSSSYPVSLNPVQHEIIYDACSELEEEECRTYWSKINLNQYHIQGNCMVSNQND